jgi:hypothetical protein
LDTARVTTDPQLLRFDKETARETCVILAD